MRNDATVTSGDCLKDSFGYKVDLDHRVSKFNKLINKMKITYPNGRYVVKDSENDEVDNNSAMGSVWTGNGLNVEESVGHVKDKEYSYEEAIELAGNGLYTVGLAATLSLSLMAMAVDMFSFSTIVALATCDFHLTTAQTHILLSMPFVGPIAMAYTWGYVSDTQGRKRSLLVAMAVSFIMAVLSAFSPNWIALAVFKFVGTCFCSCAQSVAYALLGETCAERLKGTYLLIMTSSMHTSMGVYFAIAYFVGYLQFSYDLGFVSFVPWRLLVLILALPLGLSALFLVFFYESPKFLINAGKEDQAMEVLKKISIRNCRTYYPVKKVILNEMGNLTQKSENLLQSLWQQTSPLFRPPFLQKTVLLYCLIFIIYSTSSCLFVWLPFLANDFTKSISSSDQHKGLCNIIAQGNQDSSGDEVECTTEIRLPIVIFTVSVGSMYAILNFLMAKVAARKKALMIIICVISSACCIGALHLPNNLTDIILYFSVLSDSLCMGILFTYSVEFYPTSFRGMAACLGVMVARISSIFGINFIGAYITWHCYGAFYGLTALIFSGAIFSCFLPADSVKKL